MTAPKNNIEEDKLQMSLLPLDILGEMLCPVYMEGLEKYYRESWRGGFKLTVMQDAAMRHLTEFFYKREDYDPEYPSKHHLAACIFCLISMYNSWKNYPELDDRPNRDSLKIK